MKNFIIFNSKSEILRTGNCPDSVFENQAQKEEFVIEGKANDVTQKIIFDGLDENGLPINPRVVNKTPEEIELNTPKPITIPLPPERLPANITNEQWIELSKRVDLLEEKIYQKK